MMSDEELDALAVEVRRAFGARLPIPTRDESTRATSSANWQPGWAGRTSTAQPAGPRPAIWSSSRTVLATGSSSARAGGPRVAATVRAIVKAAIHDLLGIVTHS